MIRLGFFIRYSVALVYVLLAAPYAGTLAAQEVSSGPDQLLKTASRQFNNNELDSALINFRTLAYESEKNQDLENLIRAYLYIADIKRMGQEFDSASFFLQNTKELLYQAKIPDDVLWADYYHKEGTLLLSQGNYKTARELFVQSAQIRRKTSGETDTNLVMTYNNLGLTYYFLGLFEQAMGNYQEALAIIARGEISQNKYVANSYQLTGILFATLGDYEQAGEYFLQAQSIFEKLFDPGDMNLGRLYLNVGRTMHLAGQTEKALALYNKAEEIFIKNIGPDHASVGIILLNKANIYNDYSDYEKFLHYNLKALSIFEQSLSANHPNILTAYLNLGYYYEKTGNHQQSIEYYLKSINPDHVTQTNIKTYRNMASLYGLMGDKKQADFYHQKAINSSIEIFGHGHPETALSYKSYARFLTLQGLFNEASVALHKAKKIYLEKLGPGNRHYANTLFRIGANYFDKGELLNALEACQQSIIALISDFQDSNPESNPTTEHLLPDLFLLNALFLKAKTLFDIYRQNEELPLLIAALQTYDLSSYLISRIRSSYLSEESQLMITDISNDVLIGALDCALELYYLSADPAYMEKAFEFSEKGKAAVLLASLNDLEARQLARVPEEIIRFEKNLQLSLDSYNQLIFDERLRSIPSESKIDLWQAKVFELKQRYDSLVSAIHQQFPDYHDLKFDLSVISLPGLQEILDPEQALIGFTLSDEHVFIFAVRSDTTIAVRTPLPELFFDNLDLLRNHLTGSNLHAYRISDFHDFIRVSHAVYQVLIQPVEDIIAGRELIIIPDNQLGYLPFEVLLTQDFVPSGMDFKRLKYLVKDHPISYAYSATLMQKDWRTDNRSNNGKILAFAPVYGGDQLINNVVSRHNYLLHIPWAADEVRALTNAFRGTSFIGKNASEKLFKERAPDYLVLHLAMHTLINNEAPMFSKLIFSYTNDTIEDAYLNTFELFNLELNADLAVLSACQTGDGRLQRGEGIMSMARGFFYAGVPSIIMTLWEVDDHSSSVLITLFYKYLAKAYEKDDALQAAKLEFLNASDKLKAHPHYWAGFVNIGATDPVALQKARSPWPIAAPLALLIVLSVYLLRRKRRNKK